MTADVSADLSADVSAAAAVAAAAVYTGRHRRVGGPKAAAAEPPAWSKANRLLPVQVVGFMLLIAMLGVIVLSKRFDKKEGAS